MQGIRLARAGRNETYPLTSSRGRLASALYGASWTLRIINVLAMVLCFLSLPSPLLVEHGTGHLAVVVLTLLAAADAIAGPIVFRIAMAGAQDPA